MSNSDGERRKIAGGIEKAPVYPREEQHLNTAAYNKASEAFMKTVKHMRKVLFSYTQIVGADHAEKRRQLRRSMARMIVDQNTGEPEEILALYLDMMDLMGFDKDQALSGNFDKE